MRAGIIPLQTEQPVEVAGRACENCLIDLNGYVSGIARTELEVEVTGDNSLFALVPPGYSPYAADEIEAEMREMVAFCASGHSGPH